MDYVAKSRNDQFEPPHRCAPTQAKPGSRHKVQIMAKRYHSGQPLHHASDLTWIVLPLHNAMSAFLRDLD